VRVHEPAAVTLRDSESQAWVEALRREGAEQEEAVVRLRMLLVRATRFELNRRRGQLARLRDPNLDELAEQCADDACVAVLARLDDFQGASRFTTWAYKFAILQAATAVRRLAWREREVPLAPERWTLVPSVSSPALDAERAELLAAVREEIERGLSPRQRTVLVALAVNGVPVDVLAERLRTTRGALYKTLHDARARLRKRLAERGLTP
jgi:RNA polymerase sigma-70 factor (ECF subfamily)